MPHTSKDRWSRVMSNCRVSANVEHVKDRADDSSIGTHDDYGSEIGRSRVRLGESAHDDFVGRLVIVKLVPW